MQKLRTAVLLTVHGRSAQCAAHKANVPYRPTWDSHLVVNPSMKAGDLLIFTEVSAAAASRARCTLLLHKLEPRLLIAILAGRALYVCFRAGACSRHTKLEFVETTPFAALQVQ